MSFGKSVVESEQRKLAYKDHKKRGHVQGFIPPPKNHVNERKTKKKHVEHYSHYSFKTFRIFSSYEEVEERNDPELHGYKEQHQIVQ